MKPWHYWTVFAFILLQTPQVCAIAVTSDPYSLPPTKAYLENCQKKALRLHEGSIEKQNLLHRDNRFFVQYEIYVKDGTRWFVSCDLETGNLVDE
jgi:hypothetical protein